MASNGRWAINISSNSTGNTVYNNILINLNPDRGAITIAADSLEGFFSDYNAVEDRFSPSDDATATLAAWREKTGQDRHSFIAIPSALFVNAAKADYRLRTSSPAIDAGITLPTPKQAPCHRSSRAPGDPLRANRHWALIYLAPPRRGVPFQSGNENGRAHSLLAAYSGRE